MKLITLLTAGEVARLLDVSLTAIAVAARAGELPPAARVRLRGGRSQPVFDRTSVQRFVAEAHRRYDPQPRYHDFLGRLDRGLEEICDGG